MMLVKDVATAVEAMPVSVGAGISDARMLQLVRAAAHASDCRVAVFYQRPAQGAGLDFEAVASFGVTTPLHTLRLAGMPEGAAEAEAALAAAGAASLTGDGGPALTFVAAAGVAAAGVLQGGSVLRGVLVVAGDRTARASLSAAQTYVLRAHAVQVAALLELQDLRRDAFMARAGAKRLRLLESVAVHANDAILITEAEPFHQPGPRILYCNAAFTRTTGYTEAEVLGRTPRLLQGPRTDRASLAKLHGALSRWEPVVVELLNYRKDGTTFWIELSIVPVADETGWFRHWVSVQRDVSDRKLVEETATRARIVEVEREALRAEIAERCRVEVRQTLLTRELDHRSRNALAVVQAVLRLTPRDDAETFARAVEGRVAALARAHTLLSDGRWDGADLVVLAAGELTPFLVSGAEGPQAKLSGPFLLLSPNAAQAFSMALHELATNAVKHGALSVPGGRVALSWSADVVADGEAAGLLRLCWRETGGPLLTTPPSRHGFGSRVLKATFQGQLGGTVTQSWEASGLVFEVVLPLSQVLAAMYVGSGTAAELDE